MKNHERIFFALCVRLSIPAGMKPRTVIDLLAGTIPRDRCLYYLRKWTALGIYEHDKALDLGWFVPVAQMPDRYREILEAKK